MIEQAELDKLRALPEQVKQQARDKVKQARGWAGELVGATVERDPAGAWHVTLRFEQGTIDFVALANDR